MIPLNGLTLCRVADISGWRSRAWAQFALPTIPQAMDALRTGYSGLHLAKKIHSKEVSLSKNNISYH